MRNLTKVLMIACLALIPVTGCDADPVDLDDQSYTEDTDTDALAGDPCHAGASVAGDEETADGCICMDLSTGQPYSPNCDAATDCSRCCASTGGWWAGCDIWPWMTGC